MRIGRNPEFLTARPKKNRKAVFVGINLGADYVSEHEWGIQDIKCAFGIPHTITPECLGFEARKVQTTSDYLQYEEKDGAEILLYAQSSYSRDRGISRFYKDEELQAAWSGRDFMIVSRSGKGELKELYDAFQNLNVVIFVGASGPFKNGGLKICIADRMPKEAVKQAIEKDQDYLHLQEEVSKTGIIHRLREAGRRYYACSPRWRRDNETPSEHPVIFWLNPQEQDQNDFGWFTVEELDQWIAGKGPIPKCKHGKSRRN